MEDKNCIERVRFDTPQDMPRGLSVTHAGTKVYMWQNNMCITYLMVFRKMEDFLIRNNCRMVDNSADADLILVGSCGSFFREIASYFEKLNFFISQNKRIVIYGCLPKITPQRYKEIASHIDSYIRTERPEEIEEILPSVQTRWSDLPEPDGFRMIDYRQHDPTRRYLVIQYGCDAGCVFCPHKVGIGPQVSVPREKVLEQIYCVLKQGARTIFIEGRDTGSWGTDLKPAETFPSLLSDIVSIGGVFEIFINQLGANWVIQYRDVLLDLLVHPRVVNVQIPIQTTSDRLLELMGREIGVKDLRHLLAMVRKRPDRPILRTDIMIGFPTETEEELMDTIAFVYEYFDEVACYGFEVHPNTGVAKMGLPFYEEEIIEKRVQKAISIFRKNPRMVWHRGGQDPGSMVERERRKAQLGRK